MRRIRPEKRKIAKYKDRNRDKWRIWSMLLLLLVVAISTVESYLTNTDFLCTFEKPICRWSWNASAENGFHTMSGNSAAIQFNRTGKYVGPTVDSTNLTSGHYLNLIIPSGSHENHLWSTKLSHTLRQCKIAVWLNMVNMTDGKFQVVADSLVSWVVAEINGNNNGEWERYEFIVGRIRQEFRLLLVANAGETHPAYLALDHIELIDCFPVVQKPKICTTEFFRCAPTGFDFCLNRTQLCDIRIDCINGADEKLGCDAVPAVGRCDFENDWCGWQNSPDTHVNWTRIPGIIGENRVTGPAFDQTKRNFTGMFMYANMSGPDLHFGSMALLDSSVINPPPLYHSRPESPFYKTCNVRFYYHQYGYASGSFSLYLVEHQPHGDRSMRLFYTFGDKGDTWVRNVVTIPPNLRNAYHLQFEVKRGVRGGGDVAVDDVSLSRECFGLNVPEKEKEGYNYDTFKGFPGPTLTTEMNTAFVNQTVYTFTTCGSTGRTGPKPENCTKEYNNTIVEVTVVDDPPIQGVQKWVVPRTHFYTIIAKGAAGGSGPDGQGTSKGATAIGIIKLFEGQELYILVGQEGNGGCRRNFAMLQHQSCGRVIPPKPTPPGPRYSPPRPHLSSRLSNAFKHLRKQVLQHSGGGGGGGTYVYGIGPDGRKPIIIGSGGGGLGGGHPMGETAQNGRGTDPTRSGLSGKEYGTNPPGAGGGWKSMKNRTSEVTGKSLLDGALGGYGCGTPKGYHGMGGFGGGGGGCTSGGGGGGFSGGSASSDWKNGRGGHSFLSLRMKERRVLEGSNDGPGTVIIIPAVPGCGCEYLCAAVDEYLESVKCICPNGLILDETMANCGSDETITPPPTESSERELRELHIREELVYSFLGAFALLIICLTGQIVYKCVRRARKLHKIKMAVIEQEPTAGIELHRLRQTSETMTTEQNPNYELAGPNFGSDLPEYNDMPVIPRDSLRFDGALGQGAFGEVYRGYYKENNEGPPMPVAVKTLPAFSTIEAESDFFMEALIMSKFNHPNIVRFIGVCFERHPRFLILELLAGGDLKNFLRGHRPHAGDPERLTMKELIQFARDVAQGCAYLEERRFIHRDIAARNCLLTSKGPDKLVKIADFGMARDIYRSDYYRKAGKAMLPVKWMPPEAFQDGIFTTKTDVWSYGVFLWEVMSIGFMPYLGCGNHEVMQLVARGGRLKCPKNCPKEVYAIMKQCWQRVPAQRPSFAYMLDTFNKYLQDPEILSHKVPLFTKAPKSMLRRKPKTTTVVGVGEEAARPVADDDFEDDDDDDVIADGDGEPHDNQNPSTCADSRVTYAETDFSDPRPGTSRGVLGKSTYSDSLGTVFAVASQMPPKDGLQPETSGWWKKGKSKSLDFSQKRSLSEVKTEDSTAPEFELPVISATRGPMGPKGRLGATELMKYRKNILTVGRIDREETYSVPSDEEETTYC